MSDIFASIRSRKFGARFIKEKALGKDDVPVESEKSTVKYIYLANVHAVDSSFSINVR
jgi:hypothetical protein